MPVYIILCASPETVNLCCRRWFTFLFWRWV